ncbi:MAG: flagellin [Myxococcota bacterium]
MTITSTAASMLRLETAISSARAQLTLDLNQTSSGNRLVSASVDAAGLSISDKLEAAVRSLGQAERNTHSGASLIQTADGGLSNISSTLTRMRELALQSANGTLGPSERSFLQSELEGLRDSISDIAKNTTFSATALLDGGMPESLTFQVGEGSDPEDRIEVTLPDARPGSLGTGVDPAGLDGVDISNQSSAQQALETLDAAIEDVSTQRSDLGATLTNLESSVSQLSTRRSALIESTSRIRDVDVARVSSDKAKNRILLQSSIAALAHRNDAASHQLALFDS